MVCEDSEYYFFINHLKITIMLQSDKIALHYEVIANTASKIEKVSKELSTLYRESFFNKSRANLRKYHLEKYAKELEVLLKLEL